MSYERTLIRISSSYFIVRYYWEIYIVIFIIIISKILMALKYLKKKEKKYMEKTVGT